MAIDAFSNALRHLEIFQGLKPLQITEIARNADRIVFRDGQTIITAGTPGDGAFVIMGGEAIALPDSERGLPAERIEEGTLLGEMAMLIEHDYAVTVIAKGQVRAIKINRQALHAHMLDEPAMAQHFVSRISAKLTKVALELRRIDQSLSLAAGEPDASLPVM